MSRQDERVEALNRCADTFDECIEHLKKCHLDYMPIDDHYVELIRKYVDNGSVLLDAGCGWMNSIIKRLPQDIKIIGVDIDFGCLIDNVTHDNRLCSNLEKLPFKDNTFDMIISKFVFEHIENPEIVFREFSRVSKDEGYMIIVLPNIYNPIMLIGKFTPLYLHQKFMGKVSNAYEKDIYPTYFICNSVRILDKMLDRVGFTRKDLRLSGDFTLFMYSKILFGLWMIYDKMTNNRFLKFTKMNICICYKNIGKSRIRKRK